MLCPGVSLTECELVSGDIMGDLIRMKLAVLFLLEFFADTLSGITYGHGRCAKESSNLSPCLFECVWEGKEITSFKIYEGTLAHLSMVMAGLASLCHFLCLANNH